MNALAPTLRLQPRRGRGQAIIFSALGMILLVLMVCMTLSFGSKAKAKMEVQIAADQAAYSTAVAAARTYNVLSLVNRVMVAHMTAMLGIQSAVSFSGAWCVIVWQMLVLYGLEIANQMRCCNWGCLFCGCFTALFVLLTRFIPTLMEYFRMLGSYMGLDAAAAAQANRTGFASMMLYFAQIETVSNHLYRAVDNQNITQRTLSRATGGVSDWQVDSGGDKVAKRETGFLWGPIAMGVGAINSNNLILSDRHAVMASMASRGHPFTANRENFGLGGILSGVSSMLNQAWRRIGAQTGGNDIRQYVHQGSAYFGSIPHEDSILPTSNSTFALSDDHGLGLARYAGPSCVSPIPWPLMPVSWVESNTGIGIHFGLIFTVIQNPFGPPPWPIPMIMLFFPPSGAGHNVTAFCGLNCPSAWSNFVDYNPLLVADKKDNYAQPKFPVTVYKDANLARPDPFNLFFNFRFSSSGSGQTFDLRHGAGPGGGGVVVRDGASGTADISRQMGYSTGITYYHRSQHWAEPPNLFNPYWRAGLTRADTDREATGFLGIGPDNSHDIEDTLRNSGAGWAANAYSRLYNAPGGYQGIRP